MAYRIDPSRPVRKNVRRVARRELDRALAALADPGALGLEETVHDVRKRSRKVRGLIRLARPGLGAEYGRANRDVREAARELGALRDARAPLGTFDALVAATHGDRLPGEAVGRVREGLARRAAEAEGADAVPLPGRAAERLQGVRDRLGRWSPDDDVDVLLQGLAASHRRGRHALRRCRERPTDAALHEWRKRVKCEWHHARLPGPVAPSVLGPLEQVLGALGDGLGDDHDVAVLRAAILADTGRSGADGGRPRPRTWWRSPCTGEPRDRAGTSPSTAR